MIAGGKLGQRSENQSTAHSARADSASAILWIVKALTGHRSTLMNDIGQYGVFRFRVLYLVVPPVIGQRQGFLSHHPPLNPFFAASVLLPIFSRPVERTG